MKDLTITTVLHSNLVWVFLHKRLFFFTMDVISDTQEIIIWS